MCMQQYCVVLKIPKPEGPKSHGVLLEATLSTIYLLLLCMILDAYYNYASHDWIDFGLHTPTFFTTMTTNSDNTCRLIINYGSKQLHS